MVYFSPSELLQKSNKFLQDYFFKNKFTIGDEEATILFVQFFAENVMVVGYRTPSSGRVVSTIEEFMEKVASNPSKKLRLIKRHNHQVKLF